MTKRKPGAVRGRPSLTGGEEHTPLIGARFPPEETSEIDALIPELGKTRSAVLRALVALGLQTVRRRKAREKKAKKN